MLGRRILAVLAMAAFSRGGRNDQALGRIDGFDRMGSHGRGDLTALLLGSVSAGRR